MGALDVINGTNNGGVAADRLATPRTIGGVSFDGTQNINLPGVNQAGNQNTSGTATTATNATQLGGAAASNYARKDQTTVQSFAGPIRVTGTETRGGQTVGITSSSNIGAFVS